MEAENKEYGKQEMQAPMGERQNVQDLTAEFNLPDYQPPIKRLLQVRAIPAPPDRYLGGGNGELNGTVEYHILYSGEDGGLYSACQTEDYQVVFPLEFPKDFNPDSGIVCQAEVLPENVSGRVISSRKVTVKCRLRTKIRLYGYKPLEEQMGDVSPESLERLCGESPAAQIFTGTGENLALGDEFPLDATESDIRVISGSGQVLVNEATAGSGCVDCQGDVYIKFLCSHEDTPDQPPFVLSRKIPFRQSVPADGVEVNCIACGYGIWKDMKTTVEDGKLLCEGNLRMQVRAQRNETVTYSRDVFSTASPSEIGYRTVAFPQSLACFNSRFSAHDELPLNIQIPADAVLADFNGTAIYDTVETEHGKYYVLGKCRYHAIFLTDGDCMTAESEVPFKFEADASGGIPTECNIHTDLLTCTGRYENGKLIADSEIGICAALCGETPVILVSDANFEGKWETSAPCCRICYPAPGDTLWDVAKRYHLPVNTVIRQNDLSGSAAADQPESLTGVKFLFI